MKQSLNIKQSQQLNLTPQLQQALKILQFSSAELDIEINALMESNPFLEKETQDAEAQTPPSFDTPSQNQENSDNLADVNLNNELSETIITESLWSLMDEDWQVVSQGAEVPWQNISKDNTGLQSFLLQQVNDLCLDEYEESILKQLVHCLDDQGFLTESAKELQSYIQIDDQKAHHTDIANGISLLKTLSPAGVGATCLQECYFLQLQQLESQEGLLEALLVVKEGFEFLKKQDIKNLKSHCELNDNELRLGIQVIEKLYTRPALAIDNHSTEYVVPELVCYIKNDFWHVKLNEEAVPNVGINSYYKNMLRTIKSKEDSPYLKQQLQNAQSLIKNIHSRFHTLLNVGKQIVGIQQDFFHEGPQSMKPLTLQAIADNLNLHESTISRATSGKYIATPFGILELKYFFSSHVSNMNGNEHSSTAIRALISEIIADEPHQKPFSDDKIAHFLQDEHNIKVARRTVAKYRESLNIPPSSKRKNIFK